jgi:hypothetical protein
MNSFIDLVGKAVLFGIVTITREVRYLVFGEQTLKLLYTIDIDMIYYL